jgi:hypothetical protein
MVRNDIERVKVEHELTEKPSRNRITGSTRWEKSELAISFYCLQRHSVPENDSCLAVTGFYYNGEQEEASPVATSKDTVGLFA